MTSGNLGGGTLGGVAVGDWPYTLVSGLYNSCVAGCWLRTLGAVAYRLMRSVKSSAILGGDGFGLGGGLGTVLGLSCEGGAVRRLAISWLVRERVG